MNSFWFLIGIGVFSITFFPIMIHKINKNLFPDLYKSKTVMEKKK